MCGCVCVCVCVCACVGCVRVYMCGCVCVFYAPAYLFCRAAMNFREDPEMGVANCVTVEDNERLQKF